jgi:hypothetical protein
MPPPYARTSACSQGSHWFSLRFNQPAGVRFAAGGGVQAVPSQSSGRPEPFVYDVFCCCPADRTCPLHRLNRPADGCTADALCRRFAYFLPQPIRCLPFGLPRLRRAQLRVAPPAGKKQPVSLAVVGLGLAGSVDAGRSVWRVTRKNNCPLRCVSPDLSALGGAGGVDLSHDGGLIRSLPGP